MEVTLYTVRESTSGSILVVLSSSKPVTLQLNKLIMLRLAQWRVDFCSVVGY